MVRCRAEPMPGCGLMVPLVTGCSELRFLFVLRKAVWCMEDSQLPFPSALPEHMCDPCVLPALGHSVSSWGSPENTVMEFIHCRDIHQNV